MIDVLSFSWSLADKNVPHRKIPLSECHVFASTRSSRNVLLFYLPLIEVEMREVKLHMVGASYDIMQVSMPYLTCDVVKSIRPSQWKRCLTEKPQGHLMIRYSAIYALPDLEGIQVQERERRPEVFRRER
jgi:hypothetical protein